MNGLALCAGVGGLDLAISATFPTARTVCYVEGEAYAAAILVAKMEAGLLDEAPVWSNVHTFRGAEWRGKVDFISAGFPCQPFSYAGNRETTSDERWIWHSILKIICEIRPRFLFLENVAGFVNSDGISRLLGDLSEIGFNAEWGTFRAADVGAPHRRDRFFLFGHLADSDLQPLIHMADGQCPNTCGLCKNVGDSMCQRLTESQVPAKSSEAGKSCRQYHAKRIELQGWHGEPRVCRVANGVASGVDRIRACGNGVVPRQAAKAYELLVKRAGGKL